jgi:hypothetical protein
VASFLYICSPLFQVVIYEFGLGDEMLYPIVRAAPPSALFWRLDLGPLDEAARKDFLDRVEGELRLIDEKWSGWAVAPVKRIHTFVSKEASGNGFVNKPVAAFAPYPASILRMSERVRCSLYSLINSYSAMSGRTAVAGGDPLSASAEGEPFERLALVPLTVVPAILSAVRRLNEKRVEALNREIRAFDESEDSEALRELVRVYLGVEPPERVEYPKVRVLFASPAAISRAFYEDVGREIITETGSLPGGDVSAMLDEIAAEGEAIAQSVRMDVHAKLAGLSRFLAGAARYGMRAGTPVLAGKAAARRLIRLLPAARACGLGGVAEHLVMVGEKMGEGRWRDAEAAALKAVAALDLEPGGGDAGEALSRVASELARRAHSLSSPSSQSALRKGHERRGGGGQTRSSALMDRR